MVGNELGESDPVFMKKHGDELKKDSGKWIDSSVWHGKAHTWEKIPWLIKEVSIYHVQKAVRVLISTFPFASGSESRTAGHS